jgi:hypothetical protein
MAVNESGSLNGSLAEGTTDGKYRKVRPNTTVAAGTGEDITNANRRDLHPYWNYDFIDQEKPVKVGPLDDKAAKGKRAAMPVADISNNQMLGTY